MIGYFNKKDIAAFVIALLLFFLGLLAVWFSKTNIRMCQTNNDLYYATLILAPILIYAIASGRIEHLKAGVFEAKFHVIANQQIKPSPINEEKALETNKTEVSQLDSKIKDLKRLIYMGQKIKPIILTLHLGSINETAYYGKEPLLEYIKKLSANFESFKLVVILDRNRRVKAYIPPGQLRILLSYDNADSEGNEPINNESFGKDFIEAINRGDLEKLVEIPGMITDIIKRSDTNIEALKIMFEKDIEILAVVDGKGILKGIVDQKQLSKKILAGLILEME